MTDISSPTTLPEQPSAMARTCWLIANARSGSTSDAATDAVLAALEAADIRIGGRSDFPDDALPTVAELDQADVDLVVLFAGDGTINAACTALADWDGHILVLPGGTMNLLAKALHGDRTPEKIIAALPAAGAPVALPIVRAGEHRAYVGMILGPASSWVHAREAARAGEWRRVLRAARHAWRRTFGRGIRLTGVPALAAPAQAVFVRPEAEHLGLFAVDAHDWRAIAELGWRWVRADWDRAEAVRDATAARLGIRASRPAHALIDGEPIHLPPATPIEHAMSRAQFIATAPA